MRYDAETDIFITQATTSQNKKFLSAQAKQGRKLQVKVFPKPACGQLEHWALKEKSLFPLLQVSALFTPEATKMKVNPVFF